MVQIVESEINAEFLGVVGLNNFASLISGSRLAMFCSHIGQALVVKGATKKRLITGMEREYGKYIHDISFPCNARIIKVIHKYPETVGVNRVSGKNNPISTIVYENAETNQICMLNMEKFHSVHQYFGFDYQYNYDVVNKLVPGACIAEGTVIATSPNIEPSGDYKFGLEAQVALMSEPGVIEDGVIVARSFLKRMSTKGYGTRQVSWGKTSMPVNLYGDDEHYKPFPDIGECVKDNGLLFASRKFDAKQTIPLMSKRALRNVDFSDKPVYVPANSRIVDIQVHKTNRDKTNLPHGLDEQLSFYYRKNVDYCRAMIKEYEILKRHNGDGIQLSPEYNNAVTEAYAIVTIADRGHITPTYDQQAIDDWFVTITFEYDIIPTIGFKITGMDGDKGVICEIREDHQMPVDISGNRAEVIMDPESTFKRMNPSRWYGQYFNAACYATANRVRDMVRDNKSVDEIFEYLLGFYAIISPPFHERVLKYVKDKVYHIDCICREGIYVYMPTDNPVLYDEVVAECQQKYPAVYDRVTFVDSEGVKRRTYSKVLIGGMYMLVLEKIGNTWSSVSSAKTQHFGIPARLNNSDKYSSPCRPNPVRFFGESEVRLISAMCGGDIVADILDRTNNPRVHDHECENITYAKKPTDIDRVIDRNVVPMGQGRIVTFTNHVLQCGGAEWAVWKDEYENQGA